MIRVQLWKAVQTKASLNTENYHVLSILTAFLVFRLAAVAVVGSSGLDFEPQQQPELLGSSGSEGIFTGFGSSSSTSEPEAYHPSPHRHSESSSSTSTPEKSSAFESQRHSVFSSRAGPEHPHWQSLQESLLSLSHSQLLPVALVLMNDTKSERSRCSRSWRDACFYVKGEGTLGIPYSCMLWHHGALCVGDGRRKASLHCKRGKPRQTTTHAKKQVQIGECLATGVEKRDGM